MDIGSSVYDNSRCLSCRCYSNNLGTNQSSRASRTTISQHNNPNNCLLPLISFFHYLYLFAYFVLLNTAMEFEPSWSFKNYISPYINQIKSDSMIVVALSSIKNKNKDQNKKLFKK